MLEASGSAGGPFTFDGYVLGGDRFTAADAAATIHLPVVSAVARGVLGADPLADIPGLADYLFRMEQRDTLQRIPADQRVDQPAFVDHIRKQMAAAAPV